MGRIELDGVRKEFPGGTVAVDDVTMTIEDGEFMVLVGPSGCGKTTLLRTIGGLEDVTGGRIVIGEKDVTNAAPAVRDVAMVFQNYALYPHMSVAQNLGYALRVRKIPKPEIRRRVQEAATLLGLQDLLDRRPGKLSGGQQQRVAMGRAIVREPAAFLMDEPLSNLDAKLRVTMRTSLQQLHSRLRTTTVYVTHDQVEAMTLGERVAVMRDGRVQQVDIPTRLYQEPANLFVAAFIGSPSMNLLSATMDDGAVRIGSSRIELTPDRRPDVPNGTPIVVGIRPEAFEDAEFADRGLPKIGVRVDVLEDLGADAFAFFELDSEAVIVEEALSDDEGDDGKLLADRDRTLFGARLDPRTHARVGEPLQLAVDPARLYFFSPESGESLLGRVAVAA